VGDRGRALVTGANSGIGLATVVELARTGFAAVGTVRSAAKADVVAKAAADAGVDVETAILDVTDATACEEVVARHRPRVLVNNAGFGMVGAVEDVGDDEARHAFETMVLAPVRLARLAIPPMRDAGGGRIVMVSSIYGRASTPLTGWYQGCKQALEGVTDALRMEVARDGIAVALVEPGGFRTGIWDDTASDVTRRSGSRYDTAYRRTLLTTELTEPLMGDPEECARVIATACTTRFARARYLVGYDAQTIAFWNRLTPTRVKDEIVRRAFGL
jgi:NAD(P)-dependent dehydrogenase (short-subunit alcohol dehydrogenase family)